MRVRFTVPFIAVQERPRRVTRGNRSWWYSPTSKAQSAIGQFALVARQTQGIDLFRGKVDFSLIVNGLKKGDLDNVIKAVLDACNKILWEDDRQVKKIFAWAPGEPTNAEPSMDIEVSESI